MRQKPTSQHDRDDAAHAGSADIPLATLLYRFLFFGWLFADMTQATNRFERMAALQHNSAMRRHLPVYLRRWSVLAALAFGLGCLFDRLLGASVMAVFWFAVSCVSFTLMVVISVLWLFLSKERP